MDRRPIGVFDSGLGGLSAVRELRRVLPGESVIYFGDTGRLPYGGRGVDTILRYTRQDVRFLQSFDIKAVLVACGTASTVLGDVDSSSVPLLGVVEPTVRRAALATGNGKIGVLGTQATIQSGVYARQLGALGRFEITSQSCPLFVPLVENGRTSRGDAVIEMVAREYLAPLAQAAVDTVILGCTHYPLLTDVIASILPGTALIDSGACAACALAELLLANDLLSDAERGGYTYYVSDNPEGFARNASQFLGHDAPHAVKIDIEKF